jgi:hypothetical protein
MAKTSAARSVTWKIGRKVVADMRLVLHTVV